MAANPLIFTGDIDTAALCTQLEKAIEDPKSLLDKKSAGDIKTITDRPLVFKNCTISSKIKVTETECCKSKKSIKNPLELILKLLIKHPFKSIQFEDCVFYSDSQTRAESNLALENLASNLLFTSIEELMILDPTNKIPEHASIAFSNKIRTSPKFRIIKFEMGTNATIEFYDRLTKMLRNDDTNQTNVPLFINPRLANIKAYHTDPNNHHSPFDLSLEDQLSMLKKYHTLLAALQIKLPSNAEISPVIASELKETAECIDLIKKKPHINSNNNAEEFDSRTSNPLQPTLGSTDQLHFAYSELPLAVSPSNSLLSARTSGNALVMRQSDFQSVVPTAGYSPPIPGRVMNNAGTDTATLSASQLESNRRPALFVTIPTSSATSPNF